ncbi:PAK3 [Cordylochernes scorpioides]|uniref:PAK3 n=1 Tax=Cordylochernes scorpioides TaxID=51811 RepID=A0ABY6K5R2_9ARAC|nr:PAK3 [Cordylochernes scorpioides]
MPESWARLLQNSNISKLEQKTNPQAVLDVLNWYDCSRATQESKYMTMNRTIANLVNLLQPSKSLVDCVVTQLQCLPLVDTCPRPSYLAEKYTTSPYSPMLSVGGPFLFFASPPSTPEEEEEEDDNEPPPIAARPDKTKSIYTKPVPVPLEEEFKQHCSIDRDITNNNNTPPAPRSQPHKKKKMSDEEMLEKLHSIVSVGDPNKKYTKMEKIGQG